MEAWYGRMGIPCEAYSYGTLAEAQKAAEREEDCTGYQGKCPGLDRGDMFILSPEGALLVPADRSEGHGIAGWAPATPQDWEEIAGTWGDHPEAGDMESREATLSDGTTVTLRSWYIEGVHAA